MDKTGRALNPPLNIFNGTVFSTAIDAPGNIYAAGGFTNASNNRFVAKWNGTIWTELGSGSSSLNANNTILTLATGAAGNVYAAGGFINTSGYTYVARWNGNTWSELGSGAMALNANEFIYSIVADNAGNVYAAGGFTNASGKNYVAKWDGNTWSELENGANALNANDAIFAITSDNYGNIYAGGYFTNSSGKEYVAKWNGSSWSETGNGGNSLNANDFITCLAADNNGDIYAGGDFRNAASQYYVAKWNGTTWSETGTGTNGLNANGSINTIVVKNSAEIYTAGYFTDVTGNYYIAKWSGTAWSQVNSAQSFLRANDHVSSIQVDANNNIYAGGKFTNKSGHNYIAKWDGVTWGETGFKGDPFYTSQPIYGLVADSSGNIYVSGYFMDSGGAYYLEHWNNNGWEELYPNVPGLYINAGINGMAIDKSGNVYLGGYFVDETGHNYVAKWDGNQWSKLEDFPGSLNATGVITDVETDNNGNVYVSGSFNDPVLGLCSLALWDGQKWSRLPGSAANYISNFCVADDGNIYAFGAFNAAGYYIANYNNSTHYNWTEVRNPDSSRFIAASANIFILLATDSKSNLYVNGYFNDIAGKRYVAKWDGINWSEFGVTDHLGTALTIAPSDNVYANGSIEYAGDCTVKKWNGTSWVGVGSPLTQNDVAPYGEILASDPNGNIYSDAGSFIVKFGAAGIQPPVISSFSPVSGSLGTKITITGKHFTGATSVSFGYTLASAFGVNNDSTIIATVANGSTGSVFVKTSAGADSLQGFTYTCDPLNSNIIYGGKISKYNKLTGQVQSITPQPIRNGEYRFVRTEPVIFSPIDPKTLYFAGNVLFKTQDGGESWTVISPDLSRESWDIPASVGIYASDAMKTMPRRGVIYTVAPSPLNINTIWAGTDDGYIHITKDGGKTWKNVTPSEITSWSKLSLMDASHFDVNAAYAAVNRIRCDDMHPYIYKTTDGGKTWKKIVNGLPDDPVNAVREDPKRKELLYAASETSVYFSLDNGEHWQSLRLNMPATSIRDIIIKDNDLVVATHGRGFWILDNITPLRQLNKDIAHHNTLFQPGEAFRARWNTNTDTPLPPDEPAGQNPPDGAIIDYYLKEKAQGKVMLDIVDAKGNLVSHYSSNDTLYKIPAVNIPLFWIRPQQVLSAEAGVHRFLWDMHYMPLNLPPSYPISAIYKNTAPRPTSPWAMPGNYTIKLSVNSQVFSQPLLIRMDPRVKTSLAELQKQHDLSMLCYKGRKKVTAISDETVSLHNQLKELKNKNKAELTTSLNNFDEEIINIDKGKPGNKLKSFSQVYNSFATLFDILQESDMPVTSHVANAVKDNELQLKQLDEYWSKIKSAEVPKLNDTLKSAGLPETIKIEIEIEIEIEMDKH